MADPTMIDPLKPNRDPDRCWLEWPAVDKREPVRVTGSMRDNKRSLEAASHVKIDNLTVREVEAVEGMVSGENYLRCVDGRLHAYSARQPLPDPIDDPIVGPHWERSPEPKIGHKPPGEGWHMPTVTVHSLLDNGESAARLDDWGFVCMRSRRSRDGKYWEQWWISRWMAKGELKVAIEKAGELGWFGEAEFICRFVVNQRIRFGSMDVSIQRWAMTCGDD